MDITIDVAKTIAEVEVQKKEYEREYQKALDLYGQKLAEYGSYIQKQIEKNNTETVKSPPYPPQNKIKQFEESIAILRAHTEARLVLDSSEYTNIRAGIEAIRVSNTVSMNSLSALSYH